MARKAKTLVLDSWAILAFLGDEAAGEEVAELLADAHENRTPLLMATVNAGEVWYIIARESSEADANKAIVDIRTLGIELVDSDWPLTLAAASIKSRFRMSYADCFAAALAMQNKCDLATGDLEFRQVADRVSIRWLKRQAS